MRGGVLDVYPSKHVLKNHMVALCSEDLLEFSSAMPKQASFCSLKDEKIY